MFGAILGDIIGSPYEFDRGSKTKAFDLFGPGTNFTDDSVMTLAVASALMKVGKDADTEKIRAEVVQTMREFGQRYPDAGYGGRFRKWLTSEEPKPYDSFGNGSAMRISAVGWLYDTWERTREVAVAVTDVTHNHPEGIRGALATVAAIFFSRIGVQKYEIQDLIAREFCYDLSRSLDEIRPDYQMNETCQGCIPEALTCFFEGNSYEDTVRNAVSIGGDTDTNACIAGSIAEAYYGLPEGWTDKCKSYLPEDLLEVLEEFEKAVYPAYDSDFMKYRRLRYQTDWERNEPKPGVDPEAFRALVEEGVEKDWGEAVEILAYASYTGTELFPQDYYLSRDCLKRLIDNTNHPAPEWYNTLGYIYYYGRTNDGTPEYEKALQCFTVGSSFGIFESRYKIADMLEEGNGLPKNPDAAAHLIIDMYFENRRRFEDQEFGGKFADLALRMGGLYENGHGVDKDLSTALACYMQADLAIQMRKPFREFGDGKVEERIKEGLKRVREALPKEFFKDTLTTPVPFLFGDILHNSNGMDVAYFKRDGDVYLLGAVVPEESDSRKYLFTVPELSICALSDSVILKVENAENVRVTGRDKHVFINSIILDDKTGEWQFLYGDTPMIRFKCSGFTLAK